MHCVEVNLRPWGDTHAVIAIAVLHTVTDILRQARLRPSKEYLEGFVMRRSYVILVTTSVGVAWAIS